MEIHSRQAIHFPARFDAKQAGGNIFQGISIYIKVLFLHNFE